MKLQNIFKILFVFKVEIIFPMCLFQKKLLNSKKSSKGTNNLQPKKKEKNNNKKNQTMASSEIKSDPRPTCLNGTKTQPQESHPSLSKSPHNYHTSKIGRDLSHIKSKIYRMLDSLEDDAKDLVRREASKSLKQQDLDNDLSN